MTLTGSSVWPLMLCFLWSAGPLLGSLNLDQKPNAARRRRYIEEAELFNIEVNEPTEILFSPPFFMFFMLL